MNWILVPTRRVLGRGLACLLSIAGAGTASAAGPFDGFAGAWKGGGALTTSEGKEALRCSARYDVSGGGNTLHIDVDCASDSYKVNIVSTVTSDGRTFSGTWQETTRQFSGEVSGRIPEPNTYQASLQAAGGGIQIGARTNGERQAITITSQGSEIQGASITLERR